MAQGPSASHPPTSAQPLRIGRSTVRVGTCSWTDPTLVKETDWYPRKTMSAEERLRYYAGRFPIVEVDSTYYRPPTPQLSRSWVERTPDQFRFDIKAYGLLTGHPVETATLWPDIAEAIAPEHAGNARTYATHLDPDALEEVWARCVDALQPLRDSGRLGALLLQYPPWFTPKHANREELRRLPERLPGIPVCVEFRSPKWLAAEDRDHTLKVLEEAGAALVVLDAPEVSGLDTVIEATRPDLAVVRFHGRANDTWKGRVSSAAERFRYLYNEKELAEWVPRVHQLADRASDVHVLMNNCYQDFGVRNAAQLADLLEED
jgi:uncharacterized protein YecE (DUF72 family)